MKYVTVEIPEPLYNAAREIHTAVRVGEVNENGVFEPDPIDVERLIKVDVEQGLFNWLDDTLRKYWENKNCPEHKMYEKAFEYMREFLEGYFQRIETIKKESCEKYRKEKNGRTAD